jgi:hypothetical protein
VRETDRKVVEKAVCPGYRNRKDRLVTDLQEIWQLFIREILIYYQARLLLFFQLLRDWQFSFFKIIVARVVTPCSHVAAYECPTPTPNYQTSRCQIPVGGLLCILNSLLTIGDM